MHTKKTNKHNKQKKQNKSHKYHNKKGGFNTSQFAAALTFCALSNSNKIILINKKKEDTKYELIYSTEIRPRYGTRNTKLISYGEQNTNNINIRNYDIYVEYKGDLIYIEGKNEKQKELIDKLSNYGKMAISKYNKIPNEQLPLTLQEQRNNIIETERQIIPTQRQITSNDITNTLVRVTNETTNIDRLLDIIDFIWNIIIFVFKTIIIPLILYFITYNKKPTTDITISQIQDLSPTNSSILLIENQETENSLLPDSIPSPRVESLPTDTEGEESRNAEELPSIVEEVIHNFEVYNKKFVCVEPYNHEIKNIKKRIKSCKKYNHNQIPLEHTQKTKYDNLQQCVNECYY